jgi:hypothetical protein
MVLTSSCAEAAARLVVLHDRKAAIQAALGLTLNVARAQMVLDRSWLLKGCWEPTTAARPLLPLLLSLLLLLLSCLLLLVRLLLLLLLVVVLLAAGSTLLLLPSAATLMSVGCCWAASAGIIWCCRWCRHSVSQAAGGTCQHHTQTGDK